MGERRPLGWGRRALALATTMVVTAAVIIASDPAGAGKPAGGGTGSSTPSVVDYSQCANGPATKPHPGLACNKWINGILNASNSHYAEDEVTPQRLVLMVPTAGTHSVTLRHQARKGNPLTGTHAYDSFATWNHTQGNADRCQGLTATVRTAIGCGTSASPSVIVIEPDDDESVLPIGAIEGIDVASAVTSSHDLEGELQLYGGQLLGMTDSLHSNPDFGNNDDYATTTISFQTVGVNKHVQLLFGGHLAAPVGDRGWGEGLGAANIDGGPYHIKLAGVDGASIGNRDNQIMGSSIEQFLFETQVETAAEPNVATLGVATDLADTATIFGANDPSGTVTFRLYGPFENIDAAVCSEANLVETMTTSTFTAGDLLGTYEATQTKNVTLTEPGEYYWQAEYSGDANNLFSISLCGDPAEVVVVGKRQASISTQADPVSAVVDEATDLGDTATISDAYEPTGTVTFTLHGPFSSGDALVCVREPDGDENEVARATDTSFADGTASVTVSDLTLSDAGTYYWVASYDGDDNNEPVAEIGCGESTESVTVAATPAVQTVATESTATLGEAEVLGDTAQLTDFNGVPSGTVTFSLHGPFTGPVDADDCAPGTLVAPEDDPAADLVDDIAADGTASGSATYVLTGAGDYYWVASYDSDDLNNVDASGGCGENLEKVNVPKAAPEISTVASPSTATLGEQAELGDTAELDGAFEPTGSVSFSLHGPFPAGVDQLEDACTTDNQVGSVLEDTTITGDPPTASASDEYTLGAAGDYYWIASYAGDSNNEAYTSPCGDPNEKVEVAKAQPTVDTVSAPKTATFAAAGTLGDTATISGGYELTGTIAFSLHGPFTAGSTVDAGACTVANLVGDVLDAPIVADGSSASASYTLEAAGDYYWVAAYAGDSNNASYTSPCGDIDEKVTVAPPPATFLVIDEDGVDNGSAKYWSADVVPGPGNGLTFSTTHVNDGIAAVGLRAVLPFFSGGNVGLNIQLPTGQVGDEGWFAPTQIPSSWGTPASAGLCNYLGWCTGTPGAVLAGLGGGGNQSLLSTPTPGVLPLRYLGLKGLEGRSVCAVVYDSDISINYGPITGNLTGANLGVIAFDVAVDGVRQANGFSSSTLPTILLTVRNAADVCGPGLSLYSAPVPCSSSTPADIGPASSKAYC